MEPTQPPPPLFDAFLRAVDDYRFRFDLSDFALAEAAGVGRNFIYKARGAGSVTTRQADRLLTWMRDNPCGPAKAGAEDGRAA